MSALTDEHIKEAFNLFDAQDSKDAQGRSLIDIKEAALALRALGFGELSQDQMEKFMGGGNVIRYDQFERAVKERMAPKDSEEEIERAFPHFDLDGKGKISAANLMEVARLLGENPSEDVIKEMLLEAREDGKAGDVSFEEFKHMMNQMRPK